MAESLHLVCPKCHSVNRVPADRLGDAPGCGRCASALFDGQPLSLTTAHFDRHIGRSDIPVLVDFWAPWCGPCLSMAPAYTQATGLLEPSVRLAKVDTEADPALASRYSIRSIPTLILYASGREIARRSGAQGASDIVRWVRHQMAAN